MGNARNNKDEQCYSEHGKKSFFRHNAQMRKFFRYHVGNLMVKTLGHKSKKEHADRIKMFRKLHAVDPGVRISRRDLINSLWPLFASDFTRETGGSRISVDALTWSTFIPIPMVIPPAFWKS